MKPEGIQLTLAWVRKHLVDFSFSNGSTDVDRFLLLKPFSELVFCLALLRRKGFDVTEELDWAWSQVSKGSYLLKLLIVRPDMIDLNVLCGAFFECGCRNDHLTAWLGHLQGLRTTRANEMAAWSRLSVEYSFERMGLAKGDWRSMVPPLWIDHRPEPWTIGDSIAYAITHDLFYITDFGRLRSALSHATHEYLGLWMPVWCRCFAEEEHLDLLAELLICMAFLDLRGNHKPFILKLQAAQHNDGSFQGPRGAGRTLIEGTANPERIAFLTNYHTTLVSLIAQVYVAEKL